MDEGRYIITTKNKSNNTASGPLANIQDYSPIDYGPLKRCKECDKKLNYKNAKISRYCHTCKPKVLARKDQEENYNKNPVNGINLVNELGGVK